MDPLWLLAVGMLIVVGGILVLRLHAFLALLLAALVVAVLTPDAALRRYTQDRAMAPAEADQFVAQTAGRRIAREFGNTAGSIGILIALASVVGKCLLDSGAADRIVRSAIARLGESRAPAAFLGSGFVLGIPVFFDTVFYLLIPLGKALRVRTGRNYLLYVMCIIAGATMTHSLVPPTPGPLFVANALGVNIGLMILGGLVVGAITATTGYLYARWLNRRMDLPLRDSADVTLAQLTAITQREQRELPPLWLSLLPILLPVTLIAGHSILQLLDRNGVEWAAGFLYVTRFVGEPNVALAFAAAVGMSLLVWKRQNDAPVGEAVQHALTSAGLIILITSAGGAFGAMLQQTGVGHRIEEVATVYRIGLVPLAWFVTVLVRTAQGSATIAMITAAGMLGNMVRAEALGFHPLYIALAIGCGSKGFQWMNDSGFWIISRMSGMTPVETLRASSLLMVTMALSGLLVVMLLSRLFPLIGY